MQIITYLTLTLLAVVHQSEATFHRRGNSNKHKGPLGGPFLHWGTTALDGFLRYAPDFYDVVPKVAHKLLTGGKKRTHYYDDDEYDNSLISTGKRTIKRINRILTKPHIGHVGKVHPVHHGYNGYNSYNFGDYGYDDFHGFGGFGHYQHGNFDELPVHDVFHDTIDFGHQLGLYDHDNFLDFNHGYHG